MSRRKQDEAVVERTQQILAEKAQRKRGRKAAEAEAREQQTTAQVAAEQPERPKRERPRKERKPRVHQDLLTVSFRGPLATRFRETAERHQLSLANLVQDALLAYEGHVSSGYQPGSALAEWKAQQKQEGGEA